MQQDRYLTVTALTKYIKRQFDRDAVLNDVWIRGELSNFKHHSRGHMYFTLKDEQSRIQAVMFAGHNRRLEFKPESGMKVLIHGEVTVYEPYGQYQLYAKEMQPDGLGNLFLAFEQLKKKLESEGLFASENKKPLPTIAHEIGVVTSPSGAAIRDIFTTVKRRFPLARITVFPVSVQGDHAAESIAKAIDQANELLACDLLIVGRGGGSLEDLWPFNEEIVARAIFASQIPIISAVGHETDVTIADFVADMRAATPTAAAELAVPDIKELSDRLEQREKRMTKAVFDRFAGEKKRLDHLRKSYAFKYPGQLIHQKEQDLDQLLDRLARSIKQKITVSKEQWENMNKTIRHKHPLKRFAEAEERRSQLTKRLQREMLQLKYEKEMEFKQHISKLQALSPLNVMKRGFGIIKREDRVVKSVRHVDPGDVVEVELIDGRLDCHVWGLEENDDERTTKSRTKQDV